MLQSHYSSTLDFSNVALQAAEKGFQRLMIAYKLSDSLVSSKINTEETDKKIEEIREQAYTQMNNDFSTPKMIAQLFEFVSIINKINDKTILVSEKNLQLLQTTLKEFIEDILGLQKEEAQNDNKLDGVMDLILDIRKNARQNKDWNTSDLIRDKLKDLEIKVKDGRDGASWEA